MTLVLQLIMAKMKGSSDWGAIYSIGVIGAVIYFFQRADGFVEVVVGLIKGVFWPGVIVHKVLELLNM